MHYDKNYTSVLSLLIGLTSCKKVKNNEDIMTDFEYASQLNSTYETIVIGDNSFILTTYIWRDFMPVAEENGSPVICINKLTEKVS